ncbi:Oidioi.mRNA.OKI2018_I69.chr2.g4104.t1.cds [Oikopleura dioica]|uniref:Oidioi.mRNA.OKI2018_I69.chr2.g4104.t1.cds n=1 Tax=Oikopleura dioica TaxID=34765 RepID=A0ABN7SW91_OIKDI|nr:Oidioi.mRNA.OKI2018_I69.chr2.g4104.t1.cds [Oikopleura dioica]
MRRSLKFLIGFFSFAAVFSIIFFPAYFVPKNKTTTTTEAPTTEEYTTAYSGDGSGSGDFTTDDSPLFSTDSSSLKTDGHSETTSYRSLRREDFEEDRVFEINF